MRSCAVCAELAPVEQMALEPLGRANAMVLVCPACVGDAPQERQGSHRGYPIPEGSRGSVHLAVRAAPSPGPGRPINSHNSVAPRRPGFVLVRVAKRQPDGRPIDSHEALETLRDKPWFAEVKSVGSTEMFHLFERPDVEAAAKARQESANPDPFAPLTKPRRPRR